MNRLCITVYHLRRLATLTNADFKAFTVEDAKELMKTLENATFSYKHGTRRKYSPWTVVTCKKLFKMIMRQYKKPVEVYSWVKPGQPPTNLKKEDLLTPDEVRKIITAAPSNMLRAVMSLIVETGCRPGEALNLTLGSVIVNSNHIKIYASGKMAKNGDRPLFLFNSWETIKKWLEEHPQKCNADAPLWLGKHGQPLSLQTLDTTTKRLARNAGIIKRVTPYLLRHGKATEAYLKYPPHLAQKMMGHGDLRTSRVYVHLNEEDLFNALANAHGVKTPKTGIEEANKEICPNPNCTYANPFGSIQCNKCKSPLGAAGAIKFEHDKEIEMEKLKELKELLVDPQIVDFLKSLKKPEVTGFVQSAQKVKM